MEVIQEEKKWDLKKIIAFILVVIVLGLTFKSLVLDKKGLSNFTRKSIGVEGVSTKQDSSSQNQQNELKKSVEGKLNDLKNEVNQINVVEVATSTPAVQKVLNDLKNLQNLPQSQAKDACLKICNGL